MLNPPKDFFGTICQNLNICDVSGNKKRRKDILENNVYWSDQFQIHFPHLIHKVTRKTQPKNWYLAFEKAYIDEYKFTIPHSGSLVELSSSTLAALFTAAKSGNASEFKKLYLQASSGPFDIESLSYSRDKHGYTCYDWLYRNGHQAILDDLFKDFYPRLDTIFSDKAPFERVKFVKLNLAILCNQQDFFQEHAKNFSVLPSNFLLSAVQLGSVDLVKLLFERKFNNPEITIPRAFIEAASRDYVDIVEFLHEKMLQANDAQIREKYKSTLYQALQIAIFNENKKTFEKLLDFVKENNFDINDVTLQEPSFNQNSNQKTFVLDSAAQMEDPSYAKMVLEAGANANLGSVDGYSPLEKAIYKGNYETLIVLLQKGAEFDDSDFSRVKHWIMNSRDDKNEAIKRPKTRQLIDPRLAVLVELMLYKHEIKNEPETKKSLGSWVCEMLHIEKQSDKALKSRICDLLLEIVFENRSSNDLDKLSPIEQKILEDKQYPLAHIYHTLSVLPQERIQI